jgi:hypothetical protein
VQRRRMVSWLCGLLRLKYRKEPTCSGGSSRCSQSAQVHADAQLAGDQSAAVGRRCW